MALESFQETSSLADTLAALNHAPTFACITAERRFLELLQAGCTTPIGIHTRIDGPDLHLKAPVLPKTAARLLRPPSPLRSTPPSPRLRPSTTGSAEAAIPSGKP